MKHLRMMGLALAAAFCVGQANAEELEGTLKKIKETGAITIGFRDSSIPFSYLDDNQKPIGFAWTTTRSRSALRSTSVTASSTPSRKSSSSTSSRSNTIR